MKKTLLPFVAVIALFMLPATALADTVVTKTAPATAGGAGSGGPNQFDLDHHYAYAWKLTGLGSVPAGQTITSATLTFHNMTNWDSNANVLYVHLLNSVASGGSLLAGTGGYGTVRYFQDNSGDSVADGDDFNAASVLAAAVGANNVKLTQYNNIPVSPAQNYVYNFDAAELTALQLFLSDGTIGFGFDPDCHYWNNGITFTYTYGPAVPEPVSMVLLGTGLAGLYVRRRRQQKSA